MKNKIFYILIGSLISFTPAFAVFIVDSLTGEEIKITDYSNDPIEAKYATSTFASLADYEKEKTEYLRHTETTLILNRIYGELIRLNEKQ